MAGLTGDARRVKKDVLADLVSLKHDCQNCIMEASMRKAVLAESEKDIKEDMKVIINKLNMLLKVIHDTARFVASQEVTKETEKVNDEIIFLEEQHKSLEEMEEYVKDKTSTTNMKPLQIGKEKCEETRERIDQYKLGIMKRSAKFVLHPLLAQILEQMETFSLGSTMILPVEDEFDEEADDLQEFDKTLSDSLKREPSSDPMKTSFMRSNSSKLINLSNKKQGTVSSRPGSKLDNSSVSKISVSRQSSKLESNASTPRKEEVQKKSKLITRSKTNAAVKEEVNEDDGKHSYRAIAGLKATLAERSASAPLFKLPSRQESVFIAKKTEEAPTLPVKYRDCFETKKHSNGCYITGVAVLANGHVVLCDSVHDSLQAFDAEFQHVSEMICPHPWGVAAVSDTAVAVTLHYDHKVILVQAANELERINEKDIILKCKASLLYDIKYYAYRIYILCIEGDIHIVDLKGREYGVIRTKMPSNTLKYFDIDEKNENVIISGEKGIVCLNFQGLPLWNFKTQNKSRLVCTGVLFYKGYILICDWENNSLVEIYEDGERMRTVYNDRIEKPVAICKSENSGDIFVTQGDMELSEDKARSVKVLQVDMEEK
ncbi:uncharacterized protein LOC132740511 [Ruditapes philippinarum]|uniref:uncharacterized protein LOC132740511 n=1 Tax=Ruditapes philippinarum TaxID=129788 RepID=UPI00295BE919|nr:uncharacterized protein LOC132740511 [Ruditapes philippinarum]